MEVAWYDGLPQIFEDAVPAKNWRNGENYLIDILVVYPAAVRSEAGAAMSRRPLQQQWPIPIYATGIV